MSLDMATIRGIVEKILDDQLSEKRLASMHAMFEAFKPAVKNREDAIFGYIIGWVGASALDVISLLLKRELTLEEYDEVVTAVRNRILKIKSRIHETFT